MKIGRKKLLALVAVGAGLSLGVHAASAQQTTTPLTQEQIKQIVASPDRSAADRTNDPRASRRRCWPSSASSPASALDLSAAGGYTTELLARAIGPAGSVYGQSAPRNPTSRHAAGGTRGQRNPTVPSAAALRRRRPARRGRPPRTSPTATAPERGIKTAPNIAVVLPFEDPVPPERTAFDLVTLMFNYHDLGHSASIARPMNKAVFAALKPGGVYVIADHSGRPGTGISESGTLHRVEEAFLRKEVEAAGFKLVAEGNFLRNPTDPRDKNTPDPPQPKDEFVLKFVKP